MITKETLAKIAGQTVADIYYNILVREMAAAKLDTQKEVCAFLAELICEGLKKPSENLNYSAIRITQVWKQKFPTLESALPYANNPQKLANKVYGGMYGNTDPDDGWKYRGRGPIGITFKDTYRMCSKWMGVDLVKNPEFLEMPEYGVKSAIWFFCILKDLEDEAERGEIHKISRAINTGNKDSKFPAVNEKQREEMYQYLLKQWR
jgi:putative chitinase